MLPRLQQQKASHGTRTLHQAAVAEHQDGSCCNVYVAHHIRFARASLLPFFLLSVNAFHFFFFFAFSFTISF
jgi:hypothetical protein